MGEDKEQKLTNMISSKIHELRTSIFARIWNLILWLLTAIVFFSIILTIVLTRSSDISPSLEMNSNSVLATYGMANIYLETQIVMGDKFLSDNIEFYPMGDIKEFSEHI